MTYPLRCAKDREATKDKKYLETSKARQIEFHPFVIEVLGGWGPRTSIFMKAIREQLKLIGYSGIDLYIKRSVAEIACLHRKGIIGPLLKIVQNINQSPDTGTALRYDTLDQRIGFNGLGERDIG